MKYKKPKPSSYKTKKIKKIIHGLNTILPEDTTVVNLFIFDSILLTKSQFFSYLSYLNIVYNYIIVLEVIKFWLYWQKEIVFT